MDRKPTYEELQQRIKELEKEALRCQWVQEALKESEERYRDLYENAPNAYFSVRAYDGSILECNAAAPRLLGYDKETIIGMKVFDLYADTRYGRSEAQDVFKRFKAGESIRDAELQMKHKNGQPVWISLSVEPVRDREGRVIESRSMVMDITDRKRAEEALRESEEKFRILFEASADGILITDIETKHFKYANPSFCKLLGYSEEEIEDLTIYDVHPKEKLEYIISQFEAHAKGQETLVEDIPFLRKDGTIVYVDITGTPALIHGRKCSIGFFRDITDRKRAEEALRESEKQRYRDEKRMEILKFANDVALKLMHNLRNPLVTIGGFSKRLSSRDYPEDKLKEYATIIFEGSMRLDKVLNEVLAHLKAAAEQV